MEKILQKILDLVSLILIKLTGTENGSDSEISIGTSSPTDPVIRKCEYKRGVLLTADLNNTGKLYFSFTNRVTSGKYFTYLNAGQFFSIDDYRGEIYCIADSASQTLHIGEW